MEVKEAGANFASLSELSVDAASPGYKLTEAGVVPEDWEISTVGVEFSVQLGKMLDTEKNVGISKPFLGNRAVQWGRVDPSRIGQIKLTARDLQRYRLRDGDLLVCEGGEVGRAAIWRNEIDECYYQKALHRLRSKRGYNPTLMLNVLRKHAASGVLQNFVTQTSIAHLPKDKFEQVPVPLPGKIEQEAIAEALSDADALIESLEQLIAKKCQIKQGTMQALLTGKQRLPGFTGRWESNLILDLEKIGFVKLSRGKVISKKHIDKKSGDFPIYSSSVHNEGLFGAYGDYMFDEELITWSVDGGGNFFHRPKHKFSVTNVCGFMRVDASKISPRFLASELKFLHGSKNFDYMSKAHPSVIRKEYEVVLPPLSEQVAIATILANMDAELAELETRLAKTRQLKQGMMQELLTGRIRLV